MNPASIPNIAIPRSRFMQEFTHSSTMFHGDIVPLDCFEVLPGDDFTVKRAAKEIIMSTPIAPIMGNIKLKVCAFFIPMRLVYKNTEEFFGANKTSAGPQTGSYRIPSRSLFKDTVGIYSVSHYLGKPLVSSDVSKVNYGIVSVLKERAYWLCWSEWYRAQQVQAPFVVGTTDSVNNSYIGSIGGVQKDFGSLPAKCCKQYDIFTAATLSPQYGSAVELPLGSFADVKLLNETSSSVNDGSSFTLSNDGIISAGGTAQAQGVYNTVGYKLVTDLSQATAAKINDIRYAFQLQKYLERANFGSKFFEVLAVHYGVTSPDSRLQRPEYLGGKSAPIVVRTVLSQSGYANDTTQKVGQPGASSITFVDLSGLFSKGFVEPGYVMILASTNHQRLYSQGVLQEDTKFDRFEFYSPEFNNLGDQAIKKKHLMVTGDSTDEEPWGYQGHWDEYRYRLNRVSGLLDPLASGSLDYWTLAEKFTSRPSLSSSFIEENRDCISRCLVTGATGPDYIFDFFIEYQATREMSMRAIPGLIDHFGAL